MTMVIVTMMTMIMLSYSTASYSGDGGPATTACFNGPGSVIFNSIGELYIADSGNNVVRKVKVIAAA